MEMENKFKIQDPKSPWMPKKGEKVTFCFDWVDRQMPSYKVAAGSIGTVQGEMPYLVKVGEMTVVVTPTQIRPVREAAKAQMAEPKTNCTCPPAHACPSGCPADCACTRKASCMAGAYAIKFPSEALKKEAIALLAKAGFVSKSFTPSDINEQSPIDQKEVKFAPEGVKENPESWKRYLKLKDKYENMVPESSQTYSGPEFVEYRNLKNYYDQQSIKSTYTDEQFKDEANEYVKTASKKKNDFKVGDVVRNTVAWKNLPKNTLGRVESATEHFLEIKFANSDTPFAFTGDYLEALQKDEHVQVLGNEKEIHARLISEVDQAKTFWKSAGLVDITAAASEFKNEFEQFYGKTVTPTTKWDYINFIAPRAGKKVEHYASKLNGYKNDDGAIYKIAIEDLIYEASTGNVKTATDNDNGSNRFERERQIQRLLSRTHHMGMQFTGNDVVFAPNDQPTGTNPNHAVASPRTPEYWIEKAFQYLARKQYPDATAAYKGIIGCDEAAHMSAEQKERLKRLFISYGLAIEC